VFWCGDSSWVGCRRRWCNPKFIWREEVFCGVAFGIPICCVIWYLIVVYICLLFRRDAIVMTLLLGRHAWNDFGKKHYYRCPLCRTLNHWVQIRFDRWH